MRAQLASDIVNGMAGEEVKIPRARMAEIASLADNMVYGTQKQALPIFANAAEARAFGRLRLLMESAKNGNMPRVNPADYISAHMESRIAAEPKAAPLAKATGPDAAVLERMIGGVKGRPELELSLDTNFPKNVDATLLPVNAEIRRVARVLDALKGVTPDHAPGEYLEAHTALAGNADPAEIVRLARQIVNNRLAKRTVSEESTRLGDVYTEYLRSKRVPDDPVDRQAIAFMNSRTPGALEGQPVKVDPSVLATAAEISLLVRKSSPLATDIMDMPVELRHDAMKFEQRMDSLMWEFPEAFRITSTIKVEGNTVSFGSPMLLGNTKGSTPQDVAIPTYITGPDGQTRMVMAYQSESQGVWRRFAGEVMGRYVKGPDTHGAPGEYYGEHFQNFQDDIQTGLNAARSRFRAETGTGGLDIVRPAPEGEPQKRVKITEFGLSMAKDEAHALSLIILNEKNIQTSMNRGVETPDLGRKDSPDRPARMIGYEWCESTAYGSYVSLKVESANGNFTYRIAVTEDGMFIQDVQQKGVGITPVGSPRFGAVADAKLLTPIIEYSSQLPEGMSADVTYVGVRGSRIRITDGLHTEGAFAEMNFGMEPVYRLLRARDFGSVEMAFRHIEAGQGNLPKAGAMPQVPVEKDVIASRAKTLRTGYDEYVSGRIQPETKEGQERMRELGISNREIEMFGRYAKATSRGKAKDDALDKRLEISARQWARDSILNRQETLKNGYELYAAGAMDQDAAHQAGIGNAELAAFKGLKERNAGAAEIDARLSKLAQSWTGGRAGGIPADEEITLVVQRPSKQVQMQPASELAGVILSGQSPAVSPEMRPALGLEMSRLLASPEHAQELAALARRVARGDPAAEEIMAFLPREVDAAVRELAANGRFRLNSFQEEGVFDRYAGNARTGGADIDAARQRIAQLLPKRTAQEATGTFDLAGRPANERAGRGNPQEAEAAPALTKIVTDLKDPALSLRISEQTIKGLGLEAGLEKTAMDNIRDGAWLDPANKTQLEMNRARADVLEKMTGYFAAAGKELGWTPEATRKYAEALIPLLDISERNGYTDYGHTLRVAQYTDQIMSGMNLTPAQKAKIGLAALLHDVGKIGVDNNLWRKPGRLDAAELQKTEKHAEYSSDIVRATFARIGLVKEADIAEIAALAGDHHEFFNGSRYGGKAGQNIPLGARIIAIADTYDAMTSNRSYRKGLAGGVGLTEIRKNAGTQFDPALAERFVRIMEGGPPPKNETAGR